MKENPLAGKRIAMLAHTYYLWDMRVRREAESLAEAKAHIDVICLNEQSEYKNIIKPNHEKVNGVNVHRIPLSKKRRHVAVYFFRYLVLTLIGMYKLICFNKEKKISVVHVHNMPDFLIFSGLLLKLTGTKIILDVHDPMAELYKSNSNNGKNKLFLFLIGVQEKLSYFFAQRFVTVNVSMKENLIRKGVKPDKIFVLNNFPDLKTFPIVKKPLEWPRNKKNFVLLYTGTITDHYNLEIAIKAIAKTNGILPNLKIKIIGEGDKISEINSLAHQLNIQNKVQVMAPMKASELIIEMQKADLGISTHKAGIFGDLYFSTKIVEFMSQKLPVLSSRTYTIEKYIPENAIFYFEPGNADDMAEKLIEIFRNQKQVEKRISNATKLLKTLSWQHEKEQFHNFYHHILNGSSREAQQHKS